MRLVEQHIIKQNSPYHKELDELLHKCKNLYNTGLYAVRQYYFQYRDDNTVKYKYLNYYALEKQLRQAENIDYRALPTPVAQQVLMMVDRNFKSFFNLLGKKNRGEYSERVRIPKYLPKDGRFTAVFTSIAFSKANMQQGIIKLPKQYQFRGKTDKKNVQQVRFVPKNGYIAMEVVYEKPEPQRLKDNGNYLSIDIGLNNLATCVTNTGDCFIINGKPLKSINQYYNKRLAELKSKLPDNRQRSKRIERLHFKRNNKVKDYLHKVSRMLVDYAASIDVNTIVIGHNKGWKQEINIGKRNNQNFVQIPFNMLIAMLSYKGALQGINVEVVEESYTSRCSYFDNEPICKHPKYLGKRVKRGLFKTASGRLVNADVNAALNILKKRNESCDAVALPPPAGRGFWYSPLRINV